MLRPIRYRRDGDGEKAEARVLKSYEPLANVSAVRNDRIVVLDHVDLVESPRNPAAVESLAVRLRNAGS
ncbi:hypothetical protein SUDANB132_01342 [Streptomyces sp. enrichment culture]